MGGADPNGVDPHLVPIGRNRFVVPALHFGERRLGGGDRERHDDLAVAAREEEDPLRVGVVGGEEPAVDAQGVVHRPAHQDGRGDRVAPGRKGEGLPDQRVDARDLWVSDGVGPAVIDVRRTRCSRRTGRALGARRPGRAGRSGHALRTHDPLCADGSWRTGGTDRARRARRSGGALRTFHTLQALRSLRSLRTTRPCSSGGPSRTCRPHAVPCDRGFTGRARSGDP